MAFELSFSENNQSTFHLPFIAFPPTWFPGQNAPHLVLRHSA
jgi:hypothetical protein